MIGDPQVRNRGTIGGSIANNDPAADYPAAVAGLNATVHTNRRRDRRRRLLHRHVRDRARRGRARDRGALSQAAEGGYAKFRNPASRYAIVGVFVARTGDGVRVAVTGAGPCVFRAERDGKRACRQLRRRALDGIKVKPDGLNSDIHASAEYRAHLVKVMAQRAVAAAS